MKMAFSAFHPPTIDRLYCALGKPGIKAVNSMVPMLEPARESVPEHQRTRNCCLRKDERAEQNVLFRDAFPGETERSGNGSDHSPLCRVGCTQQRSPGKHPDSGHA